MTLLYSYSLFIHILCNSTITFVSGYEHGIADSDIVVQHNTIQ